MVAPRVYQAMGQPVVGHLDPFFFEVTEQVRSLLGYCYSTRNHFNRAMSGTGSAGMEAAVANFAEPGKKFALLTNGFFGDRIGEMARRQGAEVVRLARQWGEPFDPQDVRDFIRGERPQVVAFVQAETSTGMFNQAKPICEAAREVDALVIADCVTSLGGMPVLVDENGIDIAYSCTQKGLGCPPGLAPMTVSPRALERLRTRTAIVHSWYLDLQLLDTFYAAVAWVCRTINGGLKDLAATQFQKYKSTVATGPSHTDYQPPAVSGVWPGKIIVVDCPLRPLPSCGCIPAIIASWASPANRS